MHNVSVLALVTVIFHQNTKYQKNKKLHAKNDKVFSKFWNLSIAISFSWSLYLILQVQSIQRISRQENIAKNVQYLHQAGIMIRLEFTKINRQTALELNSQLN